jgi:putative inorganic carbon (HCO3(-)) transporter
MQPVFLKYRTALLITLAASLSSAGAVLIATMGLQYGALLVAVCLSIPLVYITVNNVSMGILITFVISFLLAFVNRLFGLYQYPLGIVYDAMIFFIFLGIILKAKKEDSSLNAFSKKNVIGLLLLVWLVINVFQIFNPSAPSLLGWVLAVKSNLYPVIYFFIFYYTITSFRFIKRIILIWLGLVFLAALYSFKQRYIGLASYESFVYSNELKSSLYITWGKLRVFSFMNDPMSYAMVLLYSLILAFSFFFLKISPLKKLLLIVFFVVVLWSLLLTGTRTAYFLLPVSMLVFGLLNLNWKILTMVFVMLIVGAGVVFTSSNPQLHIFKTAFRGSEDASLNVRLKNQQFIRPYIYQKPFGWGLASTGGFGRMFNGGTMIGNFPPDSEYVRIAIENGWIGLLAWLIIQFLIFRKALFEFFMTKNQQLRIYYAAFLSLFYIIIIAQYPQEALRVPPTGIIFGFVLAMLARLRDFDGKSID